MLIRPVQVPDLPFLKHVLSTIELFPAHLLEKMIADYWKEGTDHIWLTCEWEEEPAALAYGTPEKFTEGTFNLHAVGVLKDLHRKRIGQALLAYIENLLYERGYRFLIVATSGAPAMERTRQFYLRCGYIHEATLREFWQAGEDKWIFWKKLA